MLVLSRHAGERIVIGAGTPDEIVIAYLGMRNGQGRIGVKAPLHLDVLRSELLEDDRPERKGA